MSEPLVNPGDLHDKHFDILALAALRAMVRKGLLQREDITTEMMQLGVSFDWAEPLIKLVQQMPDGGDDA